MILNERYLVALVYTHEQGLRAFWRARDDDVERGGIYDARSAAITIWSDSWTSWAQQAASTMVGTIYVAWHMPDETHCTVYQLDVELGWGREDVERHLTRLFGAAAGEGPGDVQNARRRGAR